MVPFEDTRLIAVNERLRKRVEQPKAVIDRFVGKFAKCRCTTETAVIEAFKQETPKFKSPEALLKLLLKKFEKLDHELVLHRLNQKLQVKNTAELVEKFDKKTILKTLKKIVRSMQASQAKAAKEEKEIIGGPRSSTEEEVTGGPRGTTDEEVVGGPRGTTDEDVRIFTRGLTGSTPATAQASLMRNSSQGNLAAVENIAVNALKDQGILETPQEDISDDLTQDVQQTVIKIAEKQAEEQKLNRHSRARELKKFIRSKKGQQAIFNAVLGKIANEAIKQIIGNNPTSQIQDLVTQEINNLIAKEKDAAKQAEYREILERFEKVVELVLEKKINYKQVLKEVFQDENIKSLKQLIKRIGTEEVLNRLSKLGESLEPTKKEDNVIEQMIKAQEERNKEFKKQLELLKHTITELKEERTRAKEILEESQEIILSTRLHNLESELEKARHQKDTKRISDLKKEIDSIKARL